MRLLYDPPPFITRPWNIDKLRAIKWRKKYVNVMHDDKRHKMKEKIKEKWGKYFRFHRKFFFPSPNLREYLVYLFLGFLHGILFMYTNTHPIMYTKRTYCFLNIKMNVFVYMYIIYTVIYISMDVSIFRLNFHFV